MENKISKKYLIFFSTLIATLSIIFITLAILVLCEYNFKIDKFNNFIARNRSDGLTNFIKIFTHIGSFYTLAVLALISVVVIYFVLKKKRFALFAAGTFAIVCVANYVLKLIVRRPRPEHLMIIAETGYSFPSGHAMMTFGFFALAIFAVFKFIKNKPLKITLISLFALIIIAVSFTRIYLGVHYLSDILAGWVVTAVIVIVCMIIYKTKLFHKITDNEKDK